MEKFRTIKQVLPAFKINMGGIYIDQALPHHGLDQIDPFLLVHHLKQTYTLAKRQEKVGVPPHPHRGFAPVTFVFEGGVHHRDSLNNDSVIYEGGTQWMHAGSGVVHSERPAKEVAENAETWELIQFWINVPADYKMTAPKYWPLTKEDTPVVTSEDGLINIGVVSGELNGVSGKIEAYSPIQALRLEMKAGGKMRIPIPSHYNSFMYQLDGALSINGKMDTKAKDMTYFNMDGDFIEIEALEDTRAMLLSGEPINEPLVTHGPFVMNEHQEIVDAIKDFQLGKMGNLQEVFH